MARSPHVPDAFDVYTVVVLRRPAEAPEMSEEALDALQEEHLAYRAELVRHGVLVANGPFGEQSDETYRGMSVFACDLATAADDVRRCEDAKTKVLGARDRIKKTCGSCPGGPSLDKGAPIPSTR